MPLFICSRCKCVENTALSGYWFGDREKPFCSECDPKIGKWHGAFSKQKWDGKEEVLNPPFVIGEI